MLRVRTKKFIMPSDSIAAAGTGQSTATALDGTQGFVTVSAADGTKGIKLPAPQSGRMIAVYNEHATAGLKVYPHTGGDINDGTANTAVTVDGKTLVTFMAVDTTTWAALLDSPQTFQFGGQDAKVGATAGWVLGAANNLPYLATMAASQTGGTLVIPINGLRVGDTITGFKVVAQVESAGGTVTIDGDLRAVTNVAAEPTDASIGTMTQVSVTADTAVAQAKTGLSEVVTSGKTYYLLITATTGASTDIILQACEITVAGKAL